MTVYYVRIYPANKEIASNECGRKEMVYSYSTCYIREVSLPVNSTLYVYKK
jgi:hypothetical protein